MAPIFVEMRANISEFKAKMGEASQEIEHLSKKGAGNFDKLQSVGKAAMFGIGGAAIAVGGASLEMADQFEQSRARLEQALHNVGTSFEAYKHQIGDVDSKMQDFGFTNTETESALASLALATKNPTRSLSQMGLAADIARGRHISLQQATDLLIKVQTGHVALLGRLGIATKDAAGHTLTQEQAIKKLTEMYGGNAARAADTFAGKQKMAEATVQNLAAKLGVALIPALETTIGFLSDTVHWFEKHKTTAEALAATIGAGLVVVIGAGLVGALMDASKALTLTGRAAELFGVQAAEGEAAAELPLLPWIAAIAAVGFVAFELYKHWDEVWSGIKSVVAAGWHFIKEHFTLILTVALGPLGFAIAELGKHWEAIWSGIRAALGAAWGFLKPIFGFIVSAGIWYVKTEIKVLEDVWHAAWSGIKAAMHEVWGLLKPIFDAILTGGVWLVKREIGGLELVWHSTWDTIKSVVSSAWDFLKPIFDKISAGVGGIGGAVGKVAGFVSGASGSVDHFFGGGGKKKARAAGGPVSAGSSYLVGENGPEMIVPQSNGYVLPNAVLNGRQGAQFGGLGQSAAPAPNITHVNVTVQGSVISEMRLVEAIHTGLLQKKNRGGSLGLA